MFYGCQDNGTFRLRGDFRHLRQSEFYIYSTDGGLDNIDTLHVVDGQFDWTTPLEHEATFHVIFPNQSEQIVFAAPGKSVKMRGDAEHLRATRVEGSPDNDQLTRFRLEHLEDSPAQYDEAMQQYVSDNPDSRVSIYLQHQLTLRKTQLSHLRTGQPLPAIALPPDGLSADEDTLRIDSGQPALLIFWANWKRDSQDAFYLIRRTLRANEDADRRHRLQPVSVSLDADLSKYFYTVRYDSITWPSRCYRLAWDTPVVQQLGIRDIPYYVLTDTLRRVVALGRNWEKDIAPHIDPLIRQD